MRVSELPRPSPERLDVVEGIVLLRKGANADEGLEAVDRGVACLCALAFGVIASASLCLYAG